jgi:hypothetical protein
MPYAARVADETVCTTLQNKGRGNFVGLAVAPAGRFFHTF